MENSSSTRRGRRFLIPYLILAVLALGSVAIGWASSRPSTTTIGPEGVALYDVPNLAPALTTHTGKAIDGIACATLAKEVVKYHVHVHVALYLNGGMVRLPAGIGVTQPPLIEKFKTGKFYDVGLYDCLYWLHTHVADGIIHVEAPAKQSFTLGQFFDIWNQPLSVSQVGPAKGSVVIFENGKRLIGNPRLTPLLPHGDIQIDVGTPVVPYHAFVYKVTGGCGQGTTSCSTPKG
jgi:hypothetical protein